MVISAQLTDYIWAKAMGFTGAQIPDSDGVDIGGYDSVSNSAVGRNKK